jgi:hypothetical protein
MIAAVTAYALASARAASLPLLLGFLAAADGSRSRDLPRRQHGTGSNASCRREAEKLRKKTAAKRRKR